MSIDAKNVRQTVARHMLADGFEIVFDNDKSSGVYVHDAATGREYLDLFTCFASIPVGYNHPKMTEPQFIEKIGRAAVNKITLSDIYSKEFADFLDTFYRVAMPDDFKYVFFIEGGGLAVENSLKVAMDWKLRLNYSRGDTRYLPMKVAHFAECFHGRTGYTMSLTNTDPTKTNFFTKFQWPRIPNPKVTFPLEAHLEEVIQREKRALRKLEQVLVREGNEICAIIIEPIQGEGGDNHFRDEFFVELRRLADEFDVLLIFDEVQTGVGITGKMWCYQNFSIVPDIVSFGKKSQVCGIMASDRVDSVPDNVFHRSSRINSTWGGNIVDMVRFQRVLEIIEQDDLIGNVSRNTPAMMEMLGGLQQEFPKLISNMRGLGYFAAFDVATPELRDKLRVAILEEGAIMLSCGRQTLRLRPALTFDAEDIRKAGEILHKACAKIEKLNAKAPTAATIKTE
ncbi:MAG TPA: L-lysine 6-transaminase [Acidobacteriota bacterium]|nr:L-lysine 6-transaminase [Acidobacteriota bacterium]